MRKLLYNRESECLQDLRLLVEKQTHQTLILWALDCGNYFRDLFEVYDCEDIRPRTALEKAALWAKGEIKMPEAKKAIHDCHKAASDYQDHPVVCAAARAVGHAAATVHVETHALGVVFYGLTAIYYQSEEEVRDRQIEEAITWYTERLLDWQQEDTSKYQWADFLKKNPTHNKEYLLHKKLEQSDKS